MPRNILSKIKIIIFLNFIASIFFVGSAFAESWQYISNGIQKIIDDDRVKHGIPGVEVSISFPNEASPRNFVSGTTTINGATLIKSDNLFQIGSETKSFTSITLLQLEAEKLLSLDDQIGKWLHHIPHTWKKATIRQLLNHTSGIFNYVEADEFWDAEYKNLKRVWTDKELIQFALHKKPYFLPGQGWHYSNTNYVLAGMIIKSATDNTIENEIKTRLINSIPLSNTYYIPGKYSEDIIIRMPHGYSKSGRFPDEPKDVSESNMSWGDAAGAMIATSNDTAIWLRKLITGVLLPPRQQHELMNLVDINTGQSLPSTSNKPGYGLGITRKFNSVAGEIWGHMGGTMGYISNMVWIKCNDIVISININNVQVDATDEIALMNDLISFIQKLDISKQCRINKPN